MKTFKVNIDLMSLPQDVIVDAEDKQAAKIKALDVFKSKLDNMITELQMQYKKPNCSIKEIELTKLQELQCKYKELIDVLQYLVDTKMRKETIGKDPVYMRRKQIGWLRANSILKKP